jgi:hypothetical protein
VGTLYLYFLRLQSVAEAHDTGASPLSLRERVRVRGTDSNVAGLTQRNSA